MKSQTARMQLLFRSSIWAILPEYLPSLVGLLVKGPEAFFGPEIWEAAKPATHGKGANKLTVIPVQGVLSKDGPSWLGSSYDDIADAAESAAADPNVKHIVLAVDSPGGEVLGLPETADRLAAVAKQKPLSAMVEGTSASAAFWLTSQARDINLTPSGEVGSVGVRMMHADMSKMLDDAGFKITELYAGQFKTEWSPFKPLTEEAKEDMQQRLDNVHKDFIKAVDGGRGVRATEAARINRYGEGRMLSANEALSQGLVDKIQPPNEFYRAIMPVVEQELSSPADLLRRKAWLGVERVRF